MSGSPPPRCLITGATGAVGPSVVKAFLDAGYVVRVLTRRRLKPRQLPRVEAVVGDLLDLPREAMHEVDVVVHLAALLHINAPPADMLPEYERVNIEGTRRLVSAAIENGVSRFVYSSTIAVYGPGDAGRIIDEESPVSATTPYAATKLAAEQIVLSSPIGVVLRLASIYGAGIKGNYASLVRALRRRRYIPIGRGANRRTLIHEDDAARAAVLAATQDGLHGVFNVTDGSFHTVASIVDQIARSLGRKSPAISLPVAAARFAAATVDLAAPGFGARNRLTKYLEDVAVDGSRFRRATGFVPQIDLRTGWDLTIRRMKEAGTL